jgi:glycosyltransferase involved in cell wall biosynthesis
MTKLSTTTQKDHVYPTISVIIPVYNRESRILKTVESVLKQSLQDFELIIVDDGSTDGTPKILNNLFQAYPQKITLIKQSNQGVSAARNTGIKRAAGEYIAFCDSDDLWITSKLETQLLTMKKNNWTICQTDETWIRNQKKVNPMKKHKKPSGDIFIPSLELCLVSPSATMLKKTVLEDIGLFDETLPACEDYDLWLRLALKYPIYLIDTPLIEKIGGHADQLSRKYWGMDRFRINAMRKHLFSAMPADYKKALHKTIINKTQFMVNGSFKRKKWLRYLYFKQKNIFYRLVRVYYAITKY